MSDKLWKVLRHMYLMRIFAPAQRIEDSHDCTTRSNINAHGSAEGPPSATMDQIAALDVILLTPLDLEAWWLLEYRPPVSSNLPRRICMSVLLTDRDSPPLVTIKS
jgi:hypothetical protein